MILQLFDIAGVASLTSRLLNDSGFRSVTLYRQKDDPYSISSYYRDAAHRISNNPLVMMIQLIVILLQLRPKIITIHYHQLMVPVVKLFCLLFGIHCKLIMQYHGSDFRLHGVKSYIPLLTFDTIGVTWDVVPQYGTKLENPIDDELFYPNTNIKNWMRYSNRALFIKMKPLDCLWLADWYAQVFGFELESFDVMNRWDILDHRYMGDFLRSYGWYFDMKGLDALSKTACEALACGAIVVNEMGAFTYPNDVNNELKINRIVKYYGKLAT